MKSFISFRLKDGESWDVDEILADISILIPHLILTSHYYYETQRQFQFLISKIRKKSQGTEISPDVLNNLTEQINKNETITGLCKGFEIVLENSLCRGIINERRGLRIIGPFSPEDEWARRLIEYLSNLADKGELEFDQQE